jgi:Na+-translocating ferredoxin:NAD+ oxidoreductase RnfG subunit
MRRLSPWAVLLSAPLAIHAYGEVYLSPSQACQALFPGGRFGPLQELKLSKDEVQRIEKASGVDVREPKLSYFKAGGGGLVMVDRVLGKHDFITFALGLDAGGKVAGVEILEYKETYGGQVRNAQWRDQFKGKGPGDPVTVGRDIRNISGATLSSTHISRGVRRLLEAYAVVHGRL